MAVAVVLEVVCSWRTNKRKFGFFKIRWFARVDNNGRSRKGAWEMDRAVSLSLSHRVYGEELRSPIGDPDPITEVICTHRGYQQLWRWDRGCGLASPALESIGISSLRFRSILELGSPTVDPDPTLKVYVVLCGCWQPRWWG
ncbi:hypothetical protein CRG98_010222 [Punica granatum]|uniref:Uncharacterized protein n=1 Tax=Punica granatum TaxID=22663 RepID=A0A2I0KLS0_PUNGR|nr:hypothetical protein CRG98_010222 [Punica granatum]